ncbi:hypothetical protein RMCBS344292_03745 [Rhizopus microsporus]|nr:hypothetical protein RMCBS344292_03745 [Rhizopus microsporus]
MSKSNNAVNSIVSDLMRAAAGAGARNVSDEDIDKYVADLILKEAEEKRKKYQEVGIQAYQPVTKPRPNTRFLLNVVKATDSHNQAVLRANERNINKLRKDRLKREEETRRSHDDSDSPHKRKRSSSDDSDDDRTSKKSKRKDSSRERLPEKKEKIKYRGRGKVRIECPSMDKYFSSEYDPLLDGNDDDDDKYMTANEYRKKHKKKKKKKHDE